MAARRAQELQQKLNHHLQTIGSWEAALTVRRHAVTQLLDTVSLCLADEAFPSGALRQTLSSLLTYIGPSDGQLRGFLLNELTNTTNSTTSRQLVLDFLPSAMPYVGSDNNEDNNDDDTLLESSTRDVMKALRIVLTKDPSTLMPVIGCLACLPLTESGRKESFQIALQSMKDVSETNLPVLVQATLKQAKSEEEALMALEALRTELQLMEEESANSESKESTTVVIHVVLNALLDDANENQTAKAYCCLLERILSDHWTTINEDNRSSKNPLLLLDMTVLLAFLQHPEFVETCERNLDALMQENMFPFDTLSQLMLLVCQHKKQGRPTCILYPKLIQPLLAMGIFLMLSPARFSHCTPTLPEVLKESQDYVLSLHHHADRDVKAEIVHTLLQLSEAVATKWTAKRKSRKRPLRKWELLSIQETHQEEFYEWFQVLIDDTVHATLQALAKIAKENFTNFKHILIGRLTKPSQEQHSMKHLCDILSELFEPAVSHQESSGIQTSEMMIVLQKLLFTTSSSIWATTSRGSIDNKRVVRGLLLATELVRSPFISHEDFDCVKQWVLRILLPTTRRMVDPEIGTPGLTFLKALMLNRNELDTHHHQSATTVQLRKEAFQHMKMVLANTGLIQILAYYQQQSQNGKRNGATTLAYTAKPNELFLTASAAKRKKRDMVFCLAFFLRNTELHLPSRWSDAVQWVFHLVKTYLGIGRDVSLSNLNTGKSTNNNWIPHGWLQAAIEYPTLEWPRDIPPENKKQQAAVDWANALMLESSPKLTSTVKSSELHGGVVDLLVRCENMGQLRRFLDSLMRLGLSSLLGVSLSFAVVQNAFAHYQALRTDQEGEEERSETLRLIQFQMVKIYDMEQKLGSVECLMKASMAGLQKLVRRFKLEDRAQQSRDERSLDEQDQSPSEVTTTKTSPSAEANKKDDLESPNELKEQIALSLNRLGCLKQRLFASNEFLGIDALFQCLVDTDQDKLMECIDSIIVVSAQPVDPSRIAGTMQQLIGIRQSLLNHLSSILARDAFHSGTDPNNPRDLTAGARDNFTSCADFGLYLCSKIPKMRAAIRTWNGDKHCLDNVKTLINSISILAASYLHVVFLWLARTKDDGRKKGSMPAVVTQSQSSLSDCVEACSTMLRSRGILGESNWNASNATCFVFAGFLLVLQDCEDTAIANQLLEILSLLASLGTQSNAKPLLTASWKVLHTVYVSTIEMEEAKVIRPFAFVECLTRRNERNISARKSMESCLNDTVLKRNSSSDGDNERIRQSLLRHWGISALFSDMAETGIDQLLAFSEELAALLSSIDDPFNGVRGEEKKEESANTSKGKHGLRRPSSTHGYCIPDLHVGSFPSAYETLLHISVAGMCILRLGSHEGTKESGPYANLVKLLSLFSSLLELYQKRAQLFPGRIKSIIFVATKQMLSVIDGQLQACVNWRSNQPFLSASDRAQEIYDPGAIGYLQDLIDACWTHLVVKVKEFCDFMSAEATAPHTKRRRKKGRRANARRQRDQSDDDESYTGEEDRGEVTARVNDKGRAKANTLRYAVEKVASVFVDVAASHNLPTPAFNEETTGEESAADRPQKRQARHHEKEGFHQLDSSTKARQVADLLNTNQRRPNKLRRLSTEEDSDDNLSRTDTTSKQDRKRRILIDDELEDQAFGDEEEENGESEGLRYGDSAPSEDDSSSGSFCALGHWGKDDESQASSSSGSLGLEMDPLF